METIAKAQQEVPPSLEPTNGVSAPVALEGLESGKLSAAPERQQSASDKPFEDGQGSDAPQDGTSRKRKRSIFAYDRIAVSRGRDSLPSYVVKRSKKHPRQQKALEWLTASGKDRFDEKRAFLLSQWGVKKTHKGTCVLCPEDWSSLEPVRVMDLFDADKCPTAGSGRLSYQYSDHATAFVRAVAWFEDKKWPRTGAELDNFLGAGPFKPMDASHLCHHDDCIIHITYEPAHINQDRKTCCMEAQSLRQQGLFIPEYCDKHDPPCLMQVSSPAHLNENIRY